VLRIDHAVLAVRDLEASAARLWQTHGLRFDPGGRHPRWGTANMIAPLGRDYVELLGVVEEDLGRTTVLGRALLRLSEDGDRWFSICLADDDIEATRPRTTRSATTTSTWTWICRRCCSSPRRTSPRRSPGPCSTGWR
jgi:hypothetical protein